MTCGQIVALAFTFLFCMAGVALMALSIGTDHWYEVPDTPSSPAYTFGLWRQCYTDTVPAGIPVEKLVGMNRTCVHREIIKQLESRLSQPDRLYMHLLRSHVGLICASCVLQFSTLLTLILGLWPANSCHCRSIRKVLVFRTGAVLSFLGSLLGMAGGICFIALRDLDEERREIPDAMASVRRDTALGMGSTTATVRQAALVGVGSGLYQWSFMVAWISTGLCYIQALILVYLCRFSDESSDYYYTSKKYAM